MGDELDKPLGTKLGWNRNSTKFVFETAMFRLREDSLCLSGGKEFTFRYEMRSPAVVVVPVTDKGEIVLIRQYRYPVDAWCIETPAGGCHDTGDTPLDEVVRKELREEIGAEVESLENLGDFFSSPSFSDERCHVFAAWGTRLESKPEREDTEKIQTMVVSATEAIQLARTGQIKTAACALALYLCESRLRERGLIP